MPNSANRHGAYSHVLAWSFDHASCIVAPARSAWPSHRYSTPPTHRMPHPFLPLRPSPSSSAGVRTFVPTKSAGPPVTRANPQLSFRSTFGGNPVPSPQVVYRASSSAQVSGQLSPSFARRTMASFGAKSIPAMTGLGGYG